MWHLLIAPLTEENVIPIDFTKKTPFKDVPVGAYFILELTTGVKTELRPDPLAQSAYENMNYREFHGWNVDVAPECGSRMALEDHREVVVVTDPNVIAALFGWVKEKK